MTLSVYDVANYILKRNTLNNDFTDDDENNLNDLSHLKLQKLLYYCQGFHLAILDKPLFNNEIRHWDHGPVVPDLYSEYKEYGRNPLPVFDSFDAVMIPSDSQEIIDEVLEVYNQLSPWKLRDLTHQEPPWADTGDNEEITHAKLTAYFKTQLA